MNMMNNIAPILLVEDLPDVLSWLRQLLNKGFRETPVITAETLVEAKQRLKQHTLFRFILVDLGLPDGSGLELIHEARQKQSDTPIIVTTVHDDDESLFGALKAGARGYLLKEQDENQLLFSLQQFEKGYPPLSPRIARRIMQHFQERPLSASPDTPLSPRETEVLCLIGQGLRVGEVAKQLNLAESTVSSYIRSIYEKLNITNRAEAALEAARRGLI